MTSYLRLLALLFSLLLVAGCGGSSNSDSDTDSDSDTTTDSDSDSDSDDTSDGNLSGTFVFGSDTYTVFENDGIVTITVSRNDGTTGDVTVDYATTDGTATAGADYATAMGTLAFADGETAKSIDITVIDNPDVNETRDFDVALSNPTGGAVLGTPSVTTVSILNEDGTVAIYDFESLAEGSINGQDNWVVKPMTNAEVTTDITPANGTKIVIPLALQGQAGETEISRVNDVNFSFEQFTGDTAEIQFDITGDDNGLFALGHDLNDDGMLATEEGELGVPFGFWERQLVIFRANSTNIRAGTADVGEGEESTDWYRVRLRFDFAAYGGDGAGSLAYLNLTNGDTEFKEPADLQNANLDFVGSGALDPAEWDAMFLLLRIDASNVPKADNLIPNLTGSGQ